MASAPVWLPAQAAQFSLLAALRAAQSSQRRVSSAQDLLVLPFDARLTSNSDFTRATKSGTRVTSQHFVGYLYLSPVTNNAAAKCGLIISRSVGGSVKRHRVARKVRHAVALTMSALPTGSLLVIRALAQEGDANIQSEIADLVNKLISRSQKASAK